MFLSIILLLVQAFIGLCLPEGLSPNSRFPMIGSPGGPGILRNSFLFLSVRLI